jgi:hypothetical protein
MITLATLASIAEIITSLSIFIAVVTYYVNQKQLSYQVMTNCLARYQELMQKLSVDDDFINNYKKYIDLCNEEFFYFQYGYLPNPVINEWIEGMIYFLPLNNNQNINFSHLEHINHDRYEILNNYLHDISDFLNDYPRIKKALEFENIENLDINNLNDRKKLVKKIRENITSVRDFNFGFFFYLKLRLKKYI